MDSPQVAQHRQGAARVLLLADELDGLAGSDSRAYLTGISQSIATMTLEALITA